MDHFETMSMRLKLALGLRFDLELAAAIDMKKTAFNARKKRNAFPLEKVCVFASMHPELKLDVPYILTGVASPELAEPKKTGIKTNTAKALVMTPIPFNTTPEI